MEVLCECNSYTCKKSIDIPINVRQLQMQRGLILIVDGCSMEATDEVVETHAAEGYVLTKETN